MTRAALLLAALLAAAAPARAADALPDLVTIESPSPLLTVLVQIRTGSARDPEGKEGLAYLTARLAVEGGFGDPADPVTKDKLAELTRRWGGRAYPSVTVGKEATTFSMTVPREALHEYIERVLRPMLTRPLFAEAELDRLKAEAREGLRSLRLEQIELLGLVALDNLVHEGGGYAHPVRGTSRGLDAIGPGDVRGWFAAYYAPENITVGLSSADPEPAAELREALRGAGRTGDPWVPGREIEAPGIPEKPRARVVALPKAISTGIHAAFPIEVTRGHPDYWPLYVANVWFGTHRDSVSHLYEEIREKRGYNYGDYSYVEHFEGRPFALFPPPNFPRRHQYFSIWVRPVAHEYAPHLLKAVTWELERFAREGLTEEQCAAARKKARVLYLSLAESAGRLLAARADDRFYGLETGWLDGYIRGVDEATCARMNEAVARHLRGRALSYLVVTDAAEAERIAAAIRSDAPAWGKGPEDYQIDVRERDGRRIYEVPEEKLEILRRDAAWAHHRLGVPAGRVRVVPAEKLFETADLP